MNGSEKLSIEFELEWPEGGEGTGDLEIEYDSSLFSPSDL